MLDSIRHIPLWMCDEFGYLLAGRLFAGGAVGDFSGMPLYQGGYPLLLTPAFWLTDDPAVVYRLVLVINALIGASLLPLAYIGLRRFELSRVQAYVVAMVVALIPSGLYYGQFAMTEAVLPVLMLGWLLLVHSWLTTNRPAFGVAAGVLAAYSWWIHVRGIVVMGAFVILLLVAWRRRWADPRHLAVMAGALILTALVGRQLNGWLQAAVYPQGVFERNDLMIDRLTTPDGLGWTFILSVGKIWALVTSTWGIAGIGLAAVTGVALCATTPRATRVVAALTLTCLIGIALASSAGTPDEGTVGNFLYGRYLCILAPVLVMAAAILVLRAGATTVLRACLAAVATTVGTGSLVWLAVGDRLPHLMFANIDFPEVSFLTWSWDTLKFWPATMTVALLLVLTGVALTYYRRRALFAVAAAITALDLTAAAAFTNHVSGRMERWLASYASLTPEIRPSDRVGTNYPDLYRVIWVLHAFQSRHGLTPIDRYGRFPLPGDLTLVVVPWNQGAEPRLSWPAAPPDWHVVVTHQVPGGGWVLWRRG